VPKRIVVLTCLNHAAFPRLEARWLTSEVFPRESQD